MAALSLSINAIKPLNRWDYSSIRPGPVGSVGDVLVSQRLKASLPGDFRWDATYYGRQESLYGSSVSDGQYIGFNSEGGPAKTIDSAWGGRRRFETSHGWVIQDLRQTDKSVTSILSATPQYSWRNRVASVQNASRTGDLFRRDGPGVLAPNGPTRGGAFPMVTDIVAGGGLPLVDELAPNTNTTHTEQNYKPDMGSSYSGGKQVGLSSDVGFGARVPRMR